MKTDSQTAVPSLATSFAHFLLGLDVGLLFVAACFFLPDHLWIMGTKIRVSDPITLAWAIPTLFSASAMGLAWWRPLSFLKSRRVVAALFVLLMTFGALVLVAGAFLFFVLSRVLTGC